MSKNALIVLVLFLVYYPGNKLQAQFSENDADIAALIGQMTLEEKVGQMTQINLDVVCEGSIYNLVEPHHIEPQKLREALLKYHVGSILNCGGHAYPREQWHKIIGEIQRVAQNETRLKIPILYGIDAIHGANYVNGSTLFPQQLAQAATFNPELTRKAAEVTAYETRAAGMTWNFSPVLDVARNPLWSRVFETYGEDPLVCSRFGDAAIRGYQGSATAIDERHVAACMKHFLGYGAARTGKDRTPAYISDIQLRELYLPPFQRAIESGALSLMINSGEINGIPVHASKKILTQLLRDELRFDGVAVTDWEDVIKLHQNHRVATSLKEAVFIAVEAGIDMCMVPNDFDFTRLLIELVKEGRIAETRLNTSVERILRMKKRLGILNAYKTPGLKQFPEFGSPASKSLALQTAEESITLLENRNSLLPLNPITNLFVTGPAANSMTMLNGAWTRTWQGTDTKWDDHGTHTIYEALKQQFGSVNYAEGCKTDSLTNADYALQQAKQADVIIACMGEWPSTEKPGDIDDLTLPSAQIEYIKALLQTGRPVVLVLVENRPRIIDAIADQCAAIVMAYQPGDAGGDALANIIVGKVNPSGRLPLTYPRYTGSLLWYDHKYTETLDQKFGNNAFNPQWEFGHGLSYSNIKYTDLRVSSESLSSNDSITVTVRLSNTSTRSVKESVLLFVRDHYASVTPSVKRLRDFTKIELQPGEIRNVTFTISPKHLSFIGEDLKPQTEVGAFDIYISNLKTTINYR
jgi:beta-glucosidase